MLFFLSYMSLALSNLILLSIPVNYFPSKRLTRNEVQSSRNTNNCCFLFSTLVIRFDGKTPRRSFIGCVEILGILYCIILTGHKMDNIPLTFCTVMPTVIVLKNSAFQRPSRDGHDSCLSKTLSACLHFFELLQMGTFFAASRSWKEDFFQF